MDKVIIFDMDGTVLDTIPYTIDVMNASLVELGYSSLPDNNFDELLGVSIREMSQKLIEISGDCQCDEKTEKMMTCIYKKIFCWDLYRPIQVFEGIKNLIDELKCKGFKLALLSNTPHQPVVALAEQFFPNQFDCVYGEGGKIVKKPSPQGVNTILSELKIKRENALLVGDSMIDIMTAQNADVDIIGVTWGVMSKEALEAANIFALADSSETLMKGIEKKFSAFRINN